VIDDLRVIPVSSELRAVLEMRRTDPTGQPSPPDAYVFGNGVGERLTTIKTAWRNTCRRAGIEELHFHDLRREFACRLLESSADLHDVPGLSRSRQHHNDLTVRPVRLAQALERMEAAAETRRRR
jgi:integrase